MPTLVKAYLDNNIVSAIVKKDTPAEAVALCRLLATWKGGKVNLVTSELMLEEIKPYRGSSRPEMEEMFEILEKVPIVRWDELMGVNSYGDGRTWINTPMIQNDTIYGELLKSGVKLDYDAQHVFVAFKNMCDAFLTCEKGLRHPPRALAIKKLCGGLVVQKPSDFIANQGW
jgi:hypothetical protein